MENTNSTPLFKKQNYILLLVSLGLIALSFFLMGGVSNSNPEVFNEDIFSFRRIHLAPTVFFIGIGVAIYSILKK